MGISKHVVFLMFFYSLCLYLRLVYLSCSFSVFDHSTFIKGYQNRIKK